VKAAQRHRKAELMEAISTGYSSCKSKDGIRQLNQYIAQLLKD